MLAALAPGSPAGLPWRGVRVGADPGLRQVGPDLLLTGQHKPPSLPSIFLKNS
jgi:hypothetical protein